MAASSYINHFLQPDTLIPDANNPISWNRYQYVGNNPISNNDPDGHCYPLCTMAIGAAIGAVVGAATYTYYNHGQDFNRSEYLAAVAGGAIAGGLIGTGVGLVAMEATGTAATIATFTLGAGTASIQSEVDYIASNPGDFQTDEYAVTSTVSSVVGGVTSIAPLTPSGVAIKGVAYVAGANIQYHYLSDDPTLEGHLIATGSGLFATAMDLTLSQAVRSNKFVRAPLQGAPGPSNYRYSPYQKGITETISKFEKQTVSAGGISAFISGEISYKLNSAINNRIISK